MVDLHRHDEFSFFDGFGKASELARLAKSKGYTALGLTNHGNIHGLVQHYFSCLDADIKPIMGIEAYFQPVINKEKPRYHLCLFVKNVKGYENLNRIVYKGELQKYYVSLVSFKDLEKYSEGLICSSACIAGYISSCIQENNIKKAEKAIKKFKSIFNDDFYIEIMPYKIDDEGTQEKVNKVLISLAKKYDVKCIFTSDSHYGSQEDFDTYLKMHEIANHNYNIEQTYGERYMPEVTEFTKRFFKLHSNGNYCVKNIKSVAKEIVANINELEDKVEDGILDSLKLNLPKFDNSNGEDSFALLLGEVKKGLIKKGKSKKKYIKRCKEELKIIKHHGFSDYFLIVSDYVNWTKSQGIAVGPGRGSVCNCEVAYALGITDVDSLKFGLDFRRFLRLDKKKLPDIDLDFETSRRGEVIEYIIEKYKGSAAQICSYGLYKVDNLVNDLAKVCYVDDSNEIKRIKTFLKAAIPESSFDYDAVKNSSEVRYLNKKYNNIIKHFSKLYLKVRYIGTHAAGVAMTGDNILNYCGLKKDSKTGKIITVFDLADLEKINVIKFDILGLSTMEQIRNLEELSGEKMSDDWFDDDNIYKEFREGNTDGIFQFEKGTAKNILKSIESDCFEDITAASAMNRPGPLSLDMPAVYAENKFNIKEAMKEKHYIYTKETYGTIVYQEQIQQICINIGNMSWADADKVMKLLRGSNMTEATLRVYEQEKDEMIDKFVRGATKNGFKNSEAKNLFERLLTYSFNKGHAVGYTIISLMEMYYKLYYPELFWFTKIKFAPTDGDRFKYKLNAVKHGTIIFLPHVNYTAADSLRKFEGENIIQEGLCSYKGIGLKTAQIIEDERNKHGPYKSLDDFKKRSKGSRIGNKMIDFLVEQGALEFNKKRYLNRVVKYNSSLLGRS